MDVPELGREDRVGPEEIDFAGPGVTSVQCYLTHVRQVLGQVTAPPPDPEKTPCPALGHVLHGHDYALLPRLAQGPRIPPLQRPAWRWRMGYYDWHLHPTGQSRDPHQRFFRIQPPCAASKRRVEGQDRDAVTLDQVAQIFLLVGIPAFVHHDLDPVVAGLRDPGVHPFEAEWVERTRAEDDGNRHQRSPRRISRNLCRVEGEWFWKWLFAYAKTFLPSSRKRPTRSDHHERSSSRSFLRRVWPEGNSRRSPSQRMYEKDAVAPSIRGIPG